MSNKIKLKKKKKFWSEIQSKQIFLVAFITDMFSLIFLIFNPFQIGISA